MYDPYHKQDRTNTCIFEFVALVHVLLIRHQNIEVTLFMRVYIQDAQSKKSSGCDPFEHLMLNAVQLELLEKLLLHCRGVSHAVRKLPLMKLEHASMTLSSDAVLLSEGFQGRFIHFISRWFANRCHDGR